MNRVSIALCALTLSVGVHAADLAAQMAAVTPGTWAPVVTTNTMASTDPERVPALNSNYPRNAAYHGNSGYNALWGAWNSGAFATEIGQCGGIAYLGGGHADYFGNEVVALDLCADGGPTWRRLTDPFVGPIVWPVPTGAWPDGSPSVPHTYDGIVAGGGKLMLFTTQLNLASAKINYGFMLDLATRKWEPLGLNSGTMQGVSAWDSLRNAAWFQPASAYRGVLTRFDPATRTFTALAKAPSDMVRLDSSMGYDPVHDLLVVTSFRYATKVLAEYNITAGTWVRAAQVNMPAITTGQHALQWSPQRQAWIIWMDTLNDGKVWEVKRTALNAGVPTYTWTLLTAADNTMVPSTVTHNGSYDKFQLVTVDAKEVLIGSLGIASGTWAFRLPAFR